MCKKCVILRASHILALHGMATIRPSTSVQCTYLETFLPVWLSIETYYSSVRISVLFGKWHCFQTLLRCLWWVYFEGLSFLSTLLYPLHSGCVGRIYVISRTLFQVFWIWFVQLYDFSVYTNVVHLPPNPAPSFLCLVCFAVATFALSVLREDWTAI